jgi:general secretion pathway protein G
MQTSSKKAFTMVELVFVIVVIGILAAIAVPKFAATRDDATITKAIATIGSVRSALATERQKRILRGNFTPIDSLNSDGGNNVFSKFSDDGDGNTDDVLEYPVTNCAAQGKSKGCWSVSGTTYKYTMPTSGFVDFNITNNRFNCKVPTDPNCKLLTQ